MSTRLVHAALSSAVAATTAPKARRARSAIAEDGYVAGVAKWLISPGGYCFGNTYTEMNRKDRLGNPGPARSGQQSKAQDPSKSMDPRSTKIDRPRTHSPTGLPCSQNSVGIPEGIPQPNFGDSFSHKVLAPNSCATCVRRIRAETSRGEF